MLLAEPAIAQNVIAYPERGQSPELQQRDRYDCYNWAANYDGTHPFVCAPIDILSCGAGGQCTRETAASADLPQFLKIEVGQNQICGTRVNGETLKATIDKVQHVEDRMVLQGIEGKIMWSVLIGADSGHMTLTAGGDKVGFVAFGACTQGRRVRPDQMRPTAFNEPSLAEGRA
jgi:hypothetical protein